MQIKTEIIEGRRVWTMTCSELDMFEITRQIVEYLALKNKVPQELIALCFAMGGENSTLYRFIKKQSDEGDRSCEIITKFYVLHLDGDMPPADKREIIEYGNRYMKLDMTLDEEDKQNEPTTQ